MNTIGSSIPPLSINSKRIIVKIGTQVIIERGSNSISPARLNTIVNDIAAIHTSGAQVIVVTSGAVSLGRRLLGESSTLTLPAKQACATVGQPILMQAWYECLSRHSIRAAQLLVTALDFERRSSYLNLENTLNELLERRIIPIVNENDATAVDEITEDSQSSFGDNDRLSALLASRISADILCILTSTDGVYTDNPEKNPKAELVRTVNSLHELDTVITQGNTVEGRGGVGAKIKAVRAACVCGVLVRIGSGLTENPVQRLLDSEAGTTIRSSQKVPSRKGWIGLAAGFRGIIVINAGAEDALLRKGSSLLPIGITEVRGDFSRHDVVQIQGNQGHVIGRGLCGYSSSELRAVCGKRSSEIEELHRALHEVELPHEAVHRDDLLLFVGESDGVF